MRDIIEDPIPAPTVELSNLLLRHYFPNDSGQKLKVDTPLYEVNSKIKEAFRILAKELSPRRSLWDILRGYEKGYTSEELYTKLKELGLPDRSPRGTPITSLVLSS